MPRSAAVKVQDVEKTNSFWKIGESFHCPTCEEIWSNVFLFDQHMESTHKTSIPLCLKCNRIFKSVTEKEEHYYAVHFSHQEKAFSCYLCPLKLPNIHRFDLHLKQNHGSAASEKPKRTRRVCPSFFPCNYCPQVFKIEARRQDHVRKQHLQLSCRVCSFTATTKELLQQHHQKMHMHGCTSCSLVFTTIEQLEEHKATHYMELDKKEKKKAALIIQTATENKEIKSSILLCNVCNIAFLSDLHLKIHIENGHQNKVNCLVCGLTFNSRQDVNAHMVKEHPLTKCLHCHLSFRSAQLMKLHVSDEHPEAEGDTEKITPNQKPASEKKVSKNQATVLPRFKDHEREKQHPSSANTIRKKNVIQSHQVETDKRTEGSKEPVTVNICTICNNGFVDDIHFKVHFGKCSQNKEICSICNAGFDSRQEVNAHMIKEHPLIKCPYCRNSFRCPMLRQTHMVNSHSENLHFCQICWSPFETEEELEKHSAESHPPSKKRKASSSDKQKDESKRKNETQEKSKPTDSFETEESALPVEENPSGSHIMYIKEEQQEDYEEFGENNDQNPFEAFESEVKPSCCMECGEAFTNETLLSEHMESKH